MPGKFILLAFYGFVSSKNGIPPLPPTTTGISNWLVNAGEDLIWYIYFVIGSSLEKAFISFNLPFRFFS